MPIYTYECKEGHRFDRFLKLADYKDPQTCDCGAEADKKIVPTMINCDMQPWDSYISPATGRLITSYKDRKKDMQDSGCVDYEPSLRKHVEKEADAADAKLEKKIDETVEKEIHAMPARKREKLERELTSGADCVYERR